MKCHRCDKTVNVLTSRGGRRLCEHCLLVISPPTVIVESVDLISGVFFLEVGKYESITSVTKLSDCGWFIRKIKNKINSINYKFTLEYNGRLTCPRIRNYRFSGLMATCRHARCAGEGAITKHET